jgi:hypothetical protein
MNQVINDLQVVLVSLASDLKNRVWMESYIMCCNFLEQAAQSLQFQVMNGGGFETMIEYDTELDGHINQVLSILNKEKTITSDMTIWVMSLLNYMLYLKGIVYNPNPNDLLKLVKPLQVVKLNIRENRILMEGALTWVDKKLIVE